MLRQFGVFSRYKIDFLRLILFACQNRIAGVQTDTWSKPRCSRILPDVENQQELARRLEALCRENLVLKNCLKEHWRERITLRDYLENTMQDPPVRHLFDGRIGDNVLESLEQLLAEINQIVWKQT